MFGLGSSKNDAIALLTADHRKVDQLFREFESEDDGRRKVQLATTICNELTVHATAEEDVFYPQALAALREQDADLIWEATVEHGTLEGLIESLRGVRDGDDGFEAHVKVLKEYVQHHVREEENEIFPAVKRTELDLDALGAELAQRKHQIQRELGLSLDPPPAESGEERKGRRKAA